MRLFFSTYIFFFMTLHSSVTLANKCSQILSFSPSLIKSIGSTINFHFKRGVSFESGEYLYLSRYYDTLDLVHTQSGDLISVEKTMVKDFQITQSPRENFTQSFSDFPPLAPRQAKTQIVDSMEKYKDFLSFFPSQNRKAFIEITNLKKVVFGQLGLETIDGQELIVISYGKNFRKKHILDIHMSNLKISTVQENGKTESFLTEMPALKHFDAEMKSRKEMIEKSLRENPQLLLSKEFLKYWLENPTETINWAHRFYRDRFTKEINYFKREFPDLFPAFIVNPGMLLYKTQFAKFWKTYRKKKTKDPVQIVDDFSHFLGDVTLYRGMILSKSELNAIKKNGVHSNLTRREESADILSQLYSTETYTHEEVFPRTFNQIFIQRYGAFAENVYVKTEARQPNEDLQIMIPTSPSIEIAKSVGFHANRIPWEDLKSLKKDFYVFKFNLPKLFTFSYRSPIKDLFVTDSTKFWIDGGKVFQEGHSQLETLALFLIPPSSIETITHIKEEPDQYYNSF